MTRRRRLLVPAVATIVLVCAMAYLRDPPWLARVTSGLGPWQTDDQRVSFRWTGARASLFVPSSAAAVDVPLRARIRADDPAPFVVTLAIDGLPTARATLVDGAWAHVRIRLPPPGRRRVCRLDFAVDRTWGRQRLGVMLGTITIVSR